MAYDELQRIAATKQWLAKLARVDPAEAARLLPGALHMLNRLELAGHTRLELLELYQDPIATTSLEIRKRKIGLPVPLSPDNKLIVDQIRDVHIEMAFGYKAVILDGAGASPSRAGLSESALVTAIYRAIRYLTEVMHISYRSYAPYPDGAWSEIHELYRHASSLGVLTQRVQDPLDAVSAASSILDIYKRALLLGLSDPYHLPYRTVDWVYAALESWAQLAQLQRAPVTSNQDRCQFVIDLDRDRPGEPCPPNTGVTDASHHVILDTTELAIAIHAQRCAPSEAFNLKLTGQGSLNPDLVQEMLRWMIIRWGVRPVRRFSRMHVQGTWDLTIGLNVVYYFINGGGRLGNRGGHDLVTAIPGSPPSSPDGASQYSMDWESGNESATGLYLSLGKSAGLQLGVGELVAVRPTGHDTEWAIGVIRWVKSTGPGNAEVGIERLGAAARAVTVRSIAVGSAMKSDPQMAILVPEVKPLRRRQTLITAKGVFKPHGAWLTQIADTQHIIEAKRLVESTRSFDQFEFTSAYWDALPSPRKEQSAA